MLPSIRHSIAKYRSFLADPFIANEMLVDCCLASDSPSSVKEVQQEYSLGLSGLVEEVFPCFVNISYCQYSTNAPF